MVSCTTALAQQSLFVYLQSENWQPFYVQIGDKVYSSSGIGHLVISGLSDKTCRFEVGFPQHTVQPQRFSIPLHNRDHGYELVKNGSKGWALRNWQTDEIIKPLKEAGSSSLLYGERKKDDAFATLMAAVVNDSAVLYTSIIKKESPAAPVVAGTEEKGQEVKKEEKRVQDSAAAQMVKVDSPAPSDPLPPVETAKAETVNVDTVQLNKNAVADSAVTKYDPKERGLNEKPAGVAKIQHQTKDGQTKMVFVDSSESPAKVVTVYIEAEKKETEKTPAAVVVKSEPKQETVLPSVKQEMTVEVVTNEKEPENEAEKAPEKTTEKTVRLTKEELAEQIKKETWGTAPEKRTSVTDTVTIILESNQVKKATTAEEPQPLYRPKQEPETGPAKPVTPDSAVVQMTAPAKPVAEETPKTAVTQPAAEEKKEVKQEPVKQVTEEKAEPVKPVVAEAKKEEEPVKTEKDGAKPEPSADSAVAVKNTPPVVVAKEADKPKAVLPEKKEEPAGSKVVMINSDCVKLATDNDVDKMRVKMMAESDLQKRFAIVNKYFKSMCLYARQIKGLSELFPGDDSKYRFFEMAYPFAADTANFKQLHELLTGEEYVTKFKKLVKLQ
ncbi:hypothetical protein [Niastella populi]|nr:hypothetical protein [Niastella populi]